MSQTTTGPSGPEDRRVVLSDGEIRVRVLGRGPPVLLLHGLSSHGGVWERAARRLADRYTLVVPDLLGRGASEPRPDLPYGLDRETARVRALLETMGSDPVVTVGHSQGAALALALEAATGRGRGLVLACPVTPWTRRPAALDLLRSTVVRRALAPPLSRARRPLAGWILRRRVYGDPSRADAEAVARYASPYADPARVRALLRALADWRPDHLADRIPATSPPARVLAGGRDRRIPPRDAGRLATDLGAGLEVVPEAGHLLPEEAPAAVARAVDLVYAEVGSAERAPERRRPAQG